jgi:hypothetical protein
MNEESGKPKEERTEEKGDDTHPPIPVIHTAESGEEGPKGEEQSENATALHHIPFLSRAKNWASKITIAEAGMLLLTIAIAWSSIVYTKYARRQWNVMRDQLPDIHTQADAAKNAADTARAALIRGNRPWVGVIGMPISGKTFRNAYGKKMAPVALIIKNYGPSPALHVNVGTVQSLADLGTDNTNQFPDEQFACDEPSLATKESRVDIAGPNATKHNEVIVQPVGLTIFPNESTTLNIGPLGYENTYLPELEVQVVGCIAYIDQFGTEIHHTRFCFHLPEKGNSYKSFPPPAMEPCSAGNHAD